MKARSYPWALFFILWVAAIVTTPLVLPYFYGLAQDAPHPPPIPDWTTAQLVLASMLRTAVVVAVAAGVGLWVAPKIGLGAPYLERRLYGTRLDGSESAAPISTIVWPSVFWATVTALGAFAVDAVFYYGLGETLPAPEIHARIDVAPWRSLLASFWAPISEEVVDRLFLLSLIAWILIKVFRVEGEGRGRSAALWTAIILSALFFGWYHIGNERMYTAEITTTIMIRTILIILGPGLAFGYLYWKRGLEAAMLSHFVIDVIVHFIRPVVESWI